MKSKLRLVPAMMIIETVAESEFVMTWRSFHMEMSLKHERAPRVSCMGFHSLSISQRWDASWFRDGFPAYVHPHAIDYLKLLFDQIINTSDFT